MCIKCIKKNQYGKYGKAFFKLNLIKLLLLLLLFLLSRSTVIHFYYLGYSREFKEGSCRVQRGNYKQGGEGGGRRGFKYVGKEGGGGWNDNSIS